MVIAVPLALPGFRRSLSPNFCRLIDLHRLSITPPVTCPACMDVTHYRDIDLTQVHDQISCPSDAVLEATLLTSTDFEKLPSVTPRPCCWIRCGSAVQVMVFVVMTLDVDGAVRWISSSAAPVSASMVPFGTLDRDMVVVADLDVDAVGDGDWLFILDISSSSLPTNARTTTADIKLASFLYRS